MARRTVYNSYDDDFKATAVALSEISGVLAKDVAEALDIHEVILYRWRMEMRRGEIVAKKKNINIDPEMKSELKRLQKLEREHNLLKEEHALLKKAIQHSLQRKKTSSSSFNYSRVAQKRNLRWPKTRGEAHATPWHEGG